MLIFCAGRIFHTRIQPRQPESEVLCMEKDISASYLNAIKHIPLLSQSEEASLSQKIQAGDSQALQRLVSANLRLVVSIACKLDVSCPDSNAGIMDLIQEGNIALMNAAQKFRASFSTKFSTYAYPWIIQYMIRFLNRKARCIPLPGRKERAVRKMQKMQDYFFQQNGREASAAELALYAGISEEKVKECLSCSYTVASLDAEVKDGEKTACFADMIPDCTYAPEEQLMREASKETVRSLMNSLSRREKCVLWYRYNFCCEERAKTLREISMIIGVSPEAVRQTAIRAEKRIKQAIERGQSAV